MSSMEPKGSRLTDIARVADLGFRFVVTSALGAFGGYWADQKFRLLGKFPLLTLIGFFVGFGASLFLLFRGLKTAESGKGDRPEGDS